MSRVTLPDVLKNLVTKLTGDATLAGLFQSGSVQIGSIIPEPVPREFIYYSASSIPTKVVGKRSVMDTVLIDLHVMNTKNSLSAAQMFARVYTVLEKTNTAAPGDIVESIDASSETYVSRFSIESTDTFQDIKNNTPIYGYRLTLTAIAHDWQG